MYDDSLVIAPEDEAEGDDGNEDFAEDSDDQRTPTLTDQVLEVGAQAHAGESGKEGPAREVGEVVELGVGEEARSGEERDGEEPEDELGELLPQEECFVFDLGGLSLRGPVDGVAQHHEADERRTRGLGEDGPAASLRPEERAGDDGLGRIVDSESGPHSIGLLAHVQQMANGGEGEQSDGAQRQDGGDGRRGFLLVGINGALRGHDRGDATDRRTDGEQAGELGRQAEDAAQHRHY